jgi:elongation factor P--(R)-beta-lysine ligase
VADLKSPWWARHVHADRRPVLLVRGRTTDAVRAWFRAQDFVEVETALLQRSPGNETHLHAFATQLRTPAGMDSELYLHTSPEFSCKKLLAAGERRIFTLARVFRNRERGPLHHPEFTMLEWYRAEESYGVLMQDCAALLAATAEAAGVREFVFRDRRCDPFREPDHISVADAFARFADIDLMATLSGSEADRDRFAAAVRRAGIRVAADDTWSDLFSRVVVERVEPRLGLECPAILYDYPIVEAALARRKESDPRLAERFELYACGIELANGFGELTDPLEQRSRFAAQMAEKARLYGERYPVDEDFLAALAVMPPASGVALGFDRLVMLATGAPHIEHVLWTPVVDPERES